MTSQEEQDRVQRIPADLSYFLFRDLCEGQSGGSLEVDIVAEGQGGQGSEGRSGKEVGGRSVYIERRLVTRLTWA